MKMIGKVSCVRCRRSMNIGNFIAKHWHNCRAYVRSGELRVPIIADPYRWILCPDEAKRQKIAAELQARHEHLYPKQPKAVEWSQVYRIEVRGADRYPLVRWSQHQGVE